jgi:hypothetical protein
VHFLSFVVFAHGPLIGWVILNGQLEGPERRVTALGIGWAALCVLGGLAFGYWISFWRDPNWPVTYWILENGILWKRAGALDACRWEDIEGLDLRYPRGHMRLSLQLTPDFKPTISTANNPNRLELLEFVATKATTARFLPCLRRIFDGERIKFGALWLDRAGIGGPIMAAPWCEIKSVVNGGATCYVEFRAERRWHQIPWSDISSPLLLSAIAQVLIEESERLPALDA